MAQEAPGGGGAAIVHVVSRGGNPPEEKIDNPPVGETPPVTPPVNTPPAGDQLDLSNPPEATPPAEQVTETPDFGDVGLNVAAEYFTSIGLDLNGRELEEAGKGNFALLEAKLEVMGDKAKGSAGYVSLAKEAVNRIREAAKAKGEQAVKDVHEAVGGESNWTAVRSWAASNLKADQLKQASDALNQGGFVAQAMARSLLAMAQGSPTVTVQGQRATNTNAVTEALQGNAPLTREQYRAEYKKLLVKHGSISAAQKSDELRALNARFKP